MRPILLTLIGTILTKSVSAQTIAVRVIDAATQRPVEGAILGVIDEHGKRWDQELSNSRGVAILRAPVAVRFRVRGDRVGFAGAWSEWVGPDSPKPSFAVTVVLPSNPIVLPDLTTTSTTVCKATPKAVSLTLALEEMRKNVQSASLAAQTESVRVRRYTRELAPDGTEVTPPVARPSDTLTVPFVSHQASHLHERGYADSVDGGWRFHAPDAEDLLSDEFLLDHCWRALRYPDGGVALEFEPTSDRDQADIRGAIVLDSATKELTSVEFTYQHLPDRLGAPGLGGKIWFRRLGPETLRVDRWYVRTPIFRRIERSSERAIDSLVGYQEDGGVTIDASAVASAVLGNRSARLATSYNAIEVEGRVMTPQGTGVPNAELFEGDSLVARTDATGGFAILAVPGTKAVHVRAIGFAPRDAAIEVRAATQPPTTIIMQSVAQVLDPVTVQAARPARLSAQMAGFEHRRQFGVGRFLTRETLSNPARPTVAEQLRGLQGVRLVPLRGGGLAAVTTRGGGLHGGECLLSVFQDDTELFRGDDSQQSPVDLRQVLSQDFEAIEVYVGPAQVPAEYSATGNQCGLILLWTREGR